MITLGLRTQTQRIIVDTRATWPHPWDKAGTDAALVKLAETITEPREFVLTAITRGLEPAAETPAVLHDDQALRLAQAGRPKTGTSRTVKPTERPAPRTRIVHCEVHGDGATLRADGWHSCCLTMRRSGDVTDVCDKCAPLVVAS